MTLVILSSHEYSDNWNHIKEFLLLKYTFSTLILVIGVGILSLIFGVGTAWIVSVYEFYGRKIIQWLLIKSGRLLFLVFSNRRRTASATYMTVTIFCAKFKIVGEYFIYK